MPTPEQLRKKRLEELFSEFNDKNIKLMDPIARRALEKYPFITEKKAKEYAIAVLRMLKTKKKGEKQ